MLPTTRKRPRPASISNGCTSGQKSSCPINNLRAEEQRIVATVALGHDLMDATLDTGSSRSIISSYFAHKLENADQIVKVHSRILMPNGVSQPVTEALTVRVYMGIKSCVITLLILPEVLDGLILGFDFLARIGMRIECGSLHVDIKESPYETQLGNNNRTTEERMQDAQQELIYTFLNEQQKKPNEIKIEISDMETDNQTTGLPKLVPASTRVATNNQAAGRPGVIPQTINITSIHQKNTVINALPSVIQVATENQAAGSPNIPLQAANVDHPARPEPLWGSEPVPEDADQLQNIIDSIQANRRYGKQISCKRTINSRWYRFRMSRKGKVSWKLAPHPKPTGVATGAGVVPLTTDITSTHEKNTVIDALPSVTQVDTDSQTTSNHKVSLHTDNADISACSTTLREQKKNQIKVEISDMKTDNQTTGDPEYVTAWTGVATNNPADGRPGVIPQTIDVTSIPQKNTVITALSSVIEAATNNHVAGNPKVTVQTVNADLPTCSTLWKRRKLNEGKDEMPDIETDNQTIGHPDVMPPSTKFPTENQAPGNSKIPLHAANAEHPVRPLQEPIPEDADQLQKIIDMMEANRRYGKRSSCKRAINSRWYQFRMSRTGKVSWKLVPPPKIATDNLSTGHQDVVSPTTDITSIHDENTVIDALPPFIQVATNNQVAGNPKVTVQTVSADLTACSATLWKRRKLNDSKDEMPDIETGNQSIGHPDVVAPVTRFVTDNLSTGHPGVIPQTTDITSIHNENTIIDMLPSVIQGATENQAPGNSKLPLHADNAEHPVRPLQEPIPEDADQLQKIIDMMEANRRYGKRSSCKRAINSRWYQFRMSRTGKVSWKLVPPPKIATDNLSTGHQDVVSPTTDITSIHDENTVIDALPPFIQVATNNHVAGNPKVTVQTVSADLPACSATLWKRRKHNDSKDEMPDIETDNQSIGHPDVVVPFTRFVTDNLSTVQQGLVSKTTDITSIHDENTVIDALPSFIEVATDNQTTGNHKAPLQTADADLLACFATLWKLRKLNESKDEMPDIETDQSIGHPDVVAPVTRFVTDNLSTGHPGVIPQTTDITSIHNENTIIDMLLSVIQVATENQAPGNSKIPLHSANAWPDPQQEPIAEDADQLQKIIDMMEANKRYGKRTSCKRSINSRSYQFRLSRRGKVSWRLVPSPKVANGTADVVPLTADITSTHEKNTVIDALPSVTQVDTENQAPGNSKIPLHAANAEHPVRPLQEPIPEDADQLQKIIYMMEANRRYGKRTSCKRAINSRWYQFRMSRTGKVSWKLVPPPKIAIDNWSYWPTGHPRVVPQTTDITSIHEKNTVIDALPSFIEVATDNQTTGNHKAPFHTANADLLAWFATLWKRKNLNEIKDDIPDIESDNQTTGHLDVVPPTIPFVTDNQAAGNPKAPLQTANADLPARSEPLWGPFPEDADQLRNVIEVIRGHKRYGEKISCRRWINGRWYGFKISRGGKASCSLILTPE